MHVRVLVVACKCVSSGGRLCAQTHHTTTTQRAIQCPHLLLALLPLGLFEFPLRLLRLLERLALRRRQVRRALVRVLLLLLLLLYIDR